MADSQILVLGNPNSGKSSLFNALTGLKQRTGNFPGLTMEARTGRFCHQQQHITLVDLPGTYSLYPRTLDERESVQWLLRGCVKKEIAAVLMVISATHLQQGLFLLTQIRELGLPTLVALNMMDEAKKMGLNINEEALSRATGAKVVGTQARQRIGINKLREALCRIVREKQLTEALQITHTHYEPVKRTAKQLRLNNNYLAYQCVQQTEQCPVMPDEWGVKEVDVGKHKTPRHAWQAQETLARHRFITQIYPHIVAAPDTQPHPHLRSDQLDKVLTHPVWGTALFILLLGLIFQLLFRLSAPLMDSIDHGFVWLSTQTERLFGTSGWGSLVAHGLLPGIGGVIMFVPQIAFLFLTLGFLEDTGYMSRVILLSDKWMRPFGLSGRSMIPLVSGMACAIPAIMATRGISQRKERLLSTLVIPFMSCSARLPVYVLLIGLAFPPTRMWGMLSLPGLVLLGMYLFGTMMALGASYVLNKGLKKDPMPASLLIEMPIYRLPSLRDLMLHVYDRTRSFVWGAGKVITLVAVLLWGLSSVDPEGNRMPNTSEGLSQSCLGRMGQAIEPVFAPLGYDWKISIAVLSSFAAREVFVGTMGILYGQESDHSLRESLRENRIFTPAVSLSLMMFYALSMQCFSTLAVVRREQGSWRWPLFQFLSFSCLAYLGAWMVYVLA